MGPIEDKDFKFIEEGLEFLFDESVWSNVIKFDENRDYLNMLKIGNLQSFNKEGGLVSTSGIKAVDFLGIYNNEKLYFVEVKDLKGYEIESRERLKNAGENLMTEVAYKVKDSLSCIVGAQRNSTNNIDFWKDVMCFLSNEGKNIVVILWLELRNIEELNVTRNKNKKKRRVDAVGDYQRKLRQKLKWFIEKSINVKILNIKNYSNDLSLEVNRL